MDHFSLGHLGLIPLVKRLFSGPASSPFFGCFRQLAVSFSQYAFQPYYFQLSLSGVVSPLGVPLIALIFSEASVGRIIWQDRILAMLARN